MTSSVDTSLASSQSTEEGATRQLQAIRKQIAQLQEATRAAKRRCRGVQAQILRTRCQLAYLSLCLLFRQKIAPMLGWRWAAVLIGATALGALFVVLSFSWVAGLCGMIIGAAFFTSVFTIPSDARLVPATQTLRGLIVELTDRQTGERSNLSQLLGEMAAAKKHEQEVAKQLEQYHQSRLYRLRKLAAQNWKAMRGTELEIFLEEVFSELQYSVQRTGSAGDQGVDLVVGKDGRRIAVQVKGYVDSVPNTAIQEAFTGMNVHKCDACAVITNSRFTAGGKNAAAAVGCALIDENTLPTLIVGKIDLWDQILAAKAQPEPQPAVSPSSSPRLVEATTATTPATKNLETQVKDYVNHRSTRVAGVSHNNRDGTSRQQIIRRCVAGELLRLKPEKDNPVDPKAVAVCRLNGEQIGYLPQEDAAEVTEGASAGWMYAAIINKILDDGIRGHCLGVGLKLVYARSTADKAIVKQHVEGLMKKYGQAQSS
jgi:HJR/Mrr/RecB family endonuclease